MRRAAEILGLPVIEEKSGEIIGEVHDVIFIPTSSRIKGLIVEKGNKYLLQSHNINEIGEDAVIIKKGNVLQDYEKMPGIGVKEGENSLRGEKVITSSGREVGTVEDLVIDEETGEIIGYELSEGLIQDLLEGRNILEFSEELNYGKDALIIKDLEGNKS